MKENKKDNKSKQSTHSKKATLQEWLCFSWAYLELAKIGCDYWIIRLEDPSNFLNEYKKFSSDFFYTRSFLPIIFCIKHSLELFFKRVSTSLATDIEHIHDIKILSLNLNKIDWVRVRKKINSLKDDTNQNIQVAKEICNRKGEGSLEERQKQLIGITEDYYHLKSIIDMATKEDLIFSDPKNDAFRYPENDLSVSFNYQDFTDRIGLSHFRKAKEDIDKITKCCSDIGFVLFVYAQT